MNCSELEDAIDQCVETHQSLSVSAQSHIADCAECRAVWERFQILDTAIVAWRPVKQSAGLVDAVLAELAAPVVVTVKATVPSDKRRAVRSSTAALFSVAVCLCIAILVFVQKPVIVDGLARTNHSTTIETVTNDLPLSVSQTLTSVLSDLRSEYRELANETTSAARELVSSIPHSVSVSLTTDSIDTDPLPTSEDVARAWKPFGRGVEHALGFIWNAVPSEIPSG